MIGMSISGAGYANCSTGWNCEGVTWLGVTSECCTINYSSANTTYNTPCDSNDKTVEETRICKLEYWKKEVGDTQKALDEVTHKLEHAKERSTIIQQMSEIKIVQSRFSEYQYDDKGRWKIVWIPLYKVFVDGKRVD